MVWAGISIDGHTDLHMIRNGELMAQSAGPHTASFVDNFLESEIIQCMEWLACSPDINSTRHVWDILGRHVVA
ncbi:hypothetical protein TNCV_2037091 [Trichonephila clavipes]|nr:hypothetical protein TNCV_2037091 [Trichonephila clavipes]